MTLIDHRVLIDASPEAIWQVLGDLSALPKWHANCTQVSILTTQPRGAGARRRVTMQRGPAIVEEFLSWYDNIGYEYTIVDGPGFRQNRGFIRLQAIHEGTIVQWTFEYQLGGVLAGLRDSLSLRRRLDDEIAESLNRLKRLVESAGAGMDAATREKVTMRPAPNASERAALGERQIAARKAATAETVARMAPLPPQAETAADEEVSLAAVEAPAQAADEQAEAVTVTVEEPPLHTTDTRPHPPVSAAPADTTRPAIVIDEAPLEPPFALPGDKNDVLAAEMAAEEPPISAEDTRPRIAMSATTGEPGQAPGPTPEPARSMPEERPTEAEPEPPSAPDAEPPPSDEALPPPPLPRRDVEPVGPSIWEVFGLQPPSQATAETPTDEEADSAPSDDSPDAEDEGAKDSV